MFNKLMNSHMQDEKTKTIMPLANYPAAISNKTIIMAESLLTEIWTSLGMRPYSYGKMVCLNLSISPSLKWKGVSLKVIDFSTWKFYKVFISV